MAYYRAAATALHRKNFVDNSISYSNSVSINSNSNSSTFYDCENSDSNSNSNYDVDDNKMTDNKKPVVLFSINISHLPNTVQFIVIVGGLILFMCLYGYYQELVIYGWFNRKLSLFSTFLHFAGCSIFAQLQRSYNDHHANGNNTSNNNNIFQHNTSANSNSVNSNSVNSNSDSINSNIYSNNKVNCNGPNSPVRLSQGIIIQAIPSSLRMGTAPFRIAMFYYTLLILVKASSQGLSNLSMTQINYPAKVLFKSANPIVMMIIGVTWFKKSYPTRDYFVVFLLVLGLYIFITGHDEDDHSNSPQSTLLGTIYVTLSMFGSAAVPMIQEFCINTYHVSVEDLLYYTFLGSTIFSLVLATLNGELGAGINFLINNGSVPTWLAFIAFCTFGFAGANFSTALTQHYGSLVNGISNTFRKALTLALSFLLFPDRNHLTPHKIFGVIVFFCGLLLRVFMKGESNIKVKSGESSQNDKPNLPRTHMSSGSLVDKEILLKATSLAEDDCKDEADLYTHLGTDIVNGGSLVSNRTSSTASNSSPDSLDGRSDTV